MGDIIVTIILVAIVGSACYYIYKARKKGVKCIGCASSGSCSKCQCDSSATKKD